MNLLRGAVLSMIIRGLGILCLTAFLLIVSRFLSVEDYGRVEMLLALAQLFAVLSLFGFNSTTLKFVPAYVENGDFGKVSGLLLSGYISCVIISLILFLVVFTFASVFPQSRSLDIAMTALIFSPLLGFTLLNMETLRAGGSLVSALSGYLLIRHLIALGGAIVGIQFYELSLLWVFSAIFVGLLSLFIWDIFRLAKLTFGVVPTFRFRKWLRTSFPMFVTQMSLMLTSKADIIVVGAILGLRDAAFYAIAKRIANIIGFFKLSVGSVWGPKFSLTFHQREFTKLQFLARMSWLSVFLPSLVLSIIVMVYLRQLTELYLPQMSGAVNTALILVFAQLLASFFGLPGVMLNMFEDQDYFAKITLVAGLISIVLTVPAAYLGGIEYVALVVSGARVITFALASRVCRKFYGIASFGFFSSSQFKSK
jgi:O-antigen/teichoic acid export membrane protein